MNLNNLKNQLHSIQAPNGLENRTEIHSDRIIRLTDELRSADLKQLHHIKRSRIFFILAVGIMGLTFFISLTAPHYDRSMPRTLPSLHYGILLAVFLWISGTSLIVMRKLERIDYSEPVVKFLEKAEKRFRFMRPLDWAISIIGLIILGTGTCLSSCPYLSRVFKLQSHIEWVYIGYVVFFILVTAMGFYFTWKNWLRDRSPIWHQIRAMRNDLHSN